MLGLIDNRSAKKWLTDNGIPIKKIGGKNVVDKFTFEFKRQQLVVEDLKKSYPNNWFEIYDANTEDKGMVQAIRELYPNLDLIKKTSKNRIKKYIK
ncbi:hypothetical protein [Lutimonas vermicola]|uniref:Uncharacterized protein n=1 Tax=Lutimonas vermicola TaxID=414288 RepID=A0ABU9L3C9_9FLAO